MPAGDRLHVEGKLVGDAGKVLDGGLGRRRQLLVGVVKDRKIIFRHGARLGVAPFPRRVLVQGLAQERSFPVRKSRQRTHADAVDGVPCRTGVDAHLQSRTAKPVEQQASERLEARVAGDAEAHQELEFAFGLEVGSLGAAIEQIFKLGQRVLVELGFAQLKHRFDGRNDAMAARLGEQRSVVTLRLVGIRARQIDELRPPAIEQPGPRQVLARGDHLVRRIRIGEILGLVNDDDPAGHGDVPF